MRSSLIAVLLLVGSALADDPAKDTRLSGRKTLDSYFPFTPPKDLESWTKRKLELREQLLVANGLWPMVDREVIRPTIHNPMERNGVIIEKVFFASRPGHYVTGNLYRPTLPLEKNPTAKDGKLAAVLFAHGHWKDGRFHQASKADAERWVKTKGEDDLDRGYFFMQAIPTQLARMGYIVFQFDMVGYADSTAIPHASGFTDAASELHLVSAMGLQTYNCIRSLDFLGNLPGVDPKRVGMTGASGGGTQTFITAALDDRLAAAFPAVMVSTAMQGGCICENCSYLRVGTGNVEIAAMFAPKPMAFSCAKDWTQEFLTKGFPELQKLYKLYGQEQNVAAKAWLEYPHNYNQPAREFMYQWFNKHLCGKDEPVKEQPFKPVPVKELSVFDEQHPRPEGELKLDDLRTKLIADAGQTLKQFVPEDVTELANYRRVVGVALRNMIGSDVPAFGTIAVTGYNSVKLPSGVTVHTASIGHRGGTDSITSKGLIPEGYSGTVVIWLHPKGLAGLYEGEEFAPGVKQLLDQKIAVFGLDLFEQGKTMPVDKRFAGYTFGYNRTLLAQRVADVLTAIGNLKHNAGAKTIHLVGNGETGPIAILAKSIARGAITKLAAEVQGDPFAKIKSTDDPLMLPGARKYGGLDGFLAVCAPDAVLLHGTGNTSFSVYTPAAYKIAGAEQLRIETKPLDTTAVVNWVLK